MSTPLIKFRAIFETNEESGTNIRRITRLKVSEEYDVDLINAVSNLFDRVKEINWTRTVSGEIASDIHDIIAKLRLLVNAHENSDIFSGAEKLERIINSSIYESTTTSFKEIDGEYIAILDGSVSGYSGAICPLCVYVDVRDDEDCKNTLPRRHSETPIKLTRSKPIDKNDLSRVCFRLGTDGHYHRSI